LDTIFELTHYRKKDVQRGGRLIMEMRRRLRGEDSSLTCPRSVSPGSNTEKNCQGSLAHQSYGERIKSPGEKGRCSRLSNALSKVTAKEGVPGSGNSVFSKHKKKKKKKTTTTPPRIRIQSKRKHKTGAERKRFHCSAPVSRYNVYRRRTKAEGPGGTKGKQWGRLSR